VKTILRPALLVALLAVFFLACPLVTYTEVEDNTVPLAGQTKLVVRNSNGNIQLSTAVDNSVALHMTKRVTGADATECQNRIPDITIAVTDTGGKVGVFVDMPQGGPYSYGVDIEAKLPAWFLTDIQSTNGDISGASFLGLMKLATTNGGITVSDIGATVNAQTTNGKLSLQGMSGSVQGTNTNGTIDAQVAIPDSGYCRLAGTNGSVTLRVPESTSARVFVTTTNGEIRRNGLVIAGDVGPHEIDGRLGDGAGDIRVTTTNGDVVLTGY
jgi:uncharacterized protein GlcG (DUF336 family)